MPYHSSATSIDKKVGSIQRKHVKYSVDATGVILGDFGDVTISIDNNEIFARNNKAESVYMSVTLEYNDTASGTTSAMNTECFRDQVLPDTERLIKSITVGSVSSITIVTSAYGGSEFDPEVINIKAVRHDSNEILIFAESQTYSDV